MSLYYHAFELVQDLSNTTKAQYVLREVTGWHDTPEEAAEEAAREVPRERMFVVLQVGWG